MGSRRGKREVIGPISRSSQAKGLLLVEPLERQSKKPPKGQPVNR